MGIKTQNNGDINIDNDYPYTQNYYLDGSLNVDSPQMEISYYDIMETVFIIKRKMTSYQDCVREYEIEDEFDTVDSARSFLGEYLQAWSNFDEHTPKYSRDYRSFEDILAKILNKYSLDGSPSECGRVENKVYKRVSTTTTLDGI